VTLAMHITVKLFAPLKGHGVAGRRIELPDGSKVIDLLGQLGISEDDVGVLVVNQKDATLDQVLRSGDHMTIIPPIGGG